jgi:hypothetical protein
MAGQIRELPCSVFGAPPPSPPAANLVEYLDEFGLSLAELTPAQLAMFVVARNAAEQVAPLVVPVARQARPADTPLLFERETRRTLALTSRNEEPQDCPLPDNDMDAAAMGSLEDLPRIFPVQWLAEELQPELFYVKAIDCEWLMPQWQRAEHDARHASDESPERELTDEFARADAVRPHAYVLLDTSRTMNDHDRRGAIARGVALAFLLEGHRQRTHLHLRPFTHRVGELSHGTGIDDFHAIVRRLIALPNAGQTCIQEALEQAVADIRATDHCRGADVLLITDGLSRLSRRPLGDERLHTFIVGDLFEDDPRGTANTLRSWSHSFTRLWKNRFPALLAPTLADLNAAVDELDALIDAGNLVGAEPDGGVQRAVANIKALMQELKKALASSPALAAGLRDCEARLADAQRRAARKTEEPENRRPAPRSGRVFGRFGPKGNGGEVDATDGLSLWTVIKHWLGLAWRWLRRV